MIEPIRVTEPPTGVGRKLDVPTRSACAPEAVTCKGAAAAPSWDVKTSPLAAITAPAAHDPQRLA